MLVAMLSALTACQPADSPGAQDSTDDTGVPNDTGTQVEDCEIAWDPRFDDLADAIQDDLARSDALGITAAVMVDGEIVFVAAFGSASTDGTVPVCPTTLFQIGSTTKQMTAAALLQKVEAGEVAVEDTLADQLPDLVLANGPEWTEQITVHHLLTHQGAFVDHVPWDAPSDDTELADYTYGSWAGSTFLMNPPGEFWNYSNPNWSLAGLITEERDDRLWADIVRADLFEPLGMDRTWARRADVLADGDASASHGYTDTYTPAFGTVEPEEARDVGWARPAGMVWTTPSQMMTWARFLLEGDDTVLADDLRSELFEEQVSTGYTEDSQFYGYGLIIDRGFSLYTGYYELPLWSHGGGTLSFTSEFYLVPDQDIAVSVIASGYGVDLLGSVVAAIEATIDLPEPGEGPDNTLNPDFLDHHVGSYEDAWQLGPLELARKGDGLVASLPLLDKYGYDYDPDLLVYTNTIAYIEIQGYWYDLTFIAGDDETTRYIRNRAFVFTRE